MFDLVLPLADNMTIWAPGIIVLGLFVGFLTGLFGVGGGFLLTPALNIIFGIPYPVAVGSDLLQIFCTSSISAFKHWRNKHVDIRLGLVMAASAIVGTETGKLIMDWLEKGYDSAKNNVIIFGNQHSVLQLTLDILFLFLLSIVMISVLRESSASSISDEKVKTPVSQWIQNLKIPPVIAFPASDISSLSVWGPLAISFFVGILTGLMGVGGGFIMFPILVYVIGLPTTVAVGTSAFRILFSTGYGTYTHFMSGHVELKLVGILLIGSLIGVQAGVFTAERIGGRRIRKYFSIVLGLGIAIISFRMIYSIIL